MKQGDFLKLEEEQRQGFQYENGQVSKVSEGESHLDKIKEEHPELSRFITIGKWAHRQIIELGYATGNITGIKSLNLTSTHSKEKENDDDDDDEEDEDDEEEESGVSVKDQSSEEEKEDYFEV